MNDDNISASEQSNDSINSPELDKSGKVTRCAISSPEQAFSIAQRLETNNAERNKIDSVVLRKYYGGQPHDPAVLRAELSDWRNNAPTGFMSGIVNRVTPAPIQAADAAKTLTNASLGEGSPEDEKKSEFFRQEVTRTIRGWNKWRDFLSALWQEDVLMGKAAPLNLNPFSPWPKMFNGDEVFFPEGTGQHASTVQMLAVKEDLLVHEFVDFIEDGRDIAEAAGWDFDACIEVVNEALPRQIASNDSSTPNARKWEDAIREGNVGAAQAGAKIVELYHTLGVEPDTKRVTHFIVNRKGNHELLFKKEDRFESMEDVLTLFTLQPANGKYYASIGLGRMLLNAHISLERFRNEMLDNLKMAGLVILKTDAATAPSLQLKVLHPFILTSSNAELSDQAIKANVDAYIQADNQWLKWTEQQVGSYLTGIRTDNNDPNRTATEATIDAQRDAQAKTAFLMRGLGQLANLIAQITRRLCDPETTDKAAKELQKKLKDQGNLSAEEIEKLAHATVAEVTMDLTQMHNEQIIRAYEVLKGNPSIDQDKLMERFLAAVVNLQFAKDVMLDKQGLQANESEQARQQMLETEAILAGAPGMPVSPRDDHAIHLKVAFADLKAGLPKIAKSPDPTTLDHLNAQLVHTKAHIDTWKEATTGNEGAAQEIKPFEEGQKAFESVLHNIASQMQSQMEQRQAQGATQNAPQAPPEPSNEAPDSEQPGADKEATSPSGGISEKVLIALVGQYANLPEEEKRKLETASGLGAASGPGRVVPPNSQPPKIPVKSLMTAATAPVAPIARSA